MQLDECKKKQVDLSRRVLQIMHKLASMQGSSNTLQKDEEYLRVRLENIKRDLNRPTQYKGRLNELAWQMRMQVCVCMCVCVCVCVCVRFVFLV